jgi:predicted ATP-grasp superfamily ATP-dependent carboligase
MPKDKITKVTTPKAPKTKTTRVDNSEWKATSPLSGSGQSWSEWGKSNPNREANAQSRKAEFAKEPTTMTRANTAKRDEMVQKWKDARPVTGKGGAKSDEDKAAKRDSMIAWAKANPNKGTNAGRAIREEKAKKAPAPKKSAAPKRGKKK